MQVRSCTDPFVPAPRGSTSLPVGRPGHASRHRWLDQPYSIPTSCVTSQRGFSQHLTLETDLPFLLLPSAPMPSRILRRFPWPALPMSLLVRTCMLNVFTFVASALASRYLKLISSSALTQRCTGQEYLFMPREQAARFE